MIGLICILSLYYLSILNLSLKFLYTSFVTKPRVHDWHVTITLTQLPIFHNTKPRQPLSYHKLV